MSFTLGSASIPQELLQLHQWVNWRYEMRRGKQTKVPYNPRTLKHASSTAAHTWGTYQEAVMRVSGKTGLGIVLTPPYIGIDLDHCVDAQGELSLLAQEILARFSTTYHEWSPSGMGIHLFLRGNLAKSVHTPLGEVYTTGRYFTVTGQALPHAFPTVLAVSDSDIAWLIAKLTPTRHKDLAKQQPINVTDTAYADTALFAALSQNDPLWLPIWRKAIPLEGTQGDQSDSAYEMSLARRAVQNGVEDQDIYKLLVQWRDVHHIVAKHHKALVLTIENAHKEWVSSQDEKVLDVPESVDAPDRFILARKLVHLPVVRLVQMGRGEAHYRAHLSSGEVLDFGNYAGFKNVDTWERYVWEYAGKHLFTEKKRWTKICRLLLTLCDVEETEEMSSAAETRAWLTEYLSELMHHPATVDTLKQAAPFIDQTGQYVQLDAFHSYVRIHCRAPVTRSAMMGRLRVLGWAEVKLTRTAEDGKRTITRNYWHIAL